MFVTMEQPPAGRRIKLLRKKKKKGALSPDEGKTEIPLGCRRLRRVLNSSFGRRSDANLQGQSQQDCATTIQI